jgi:aspartate aminotransferase
MASTGQSRATSGGGRAGARARGLEPVAFRETADITRQVVAAGREVLSLYGSPHWLPPQHVLDAARAAVSENTAVPVGGLPALQVAIAARLARENGMLVDPESEVLVTNAANHGLSVLFTTILDPGDEVLTFAPHYYYQGLIGLAGGVPTYADTSQENGWAWDHDALRAAVTPRTKVLLVNTPTNPTGYVANPADLRAIAELAAERDLLIVSDEAYDHTIYDGARHLSIAAVPAAAGRTVTVVSATKSYVMRHWRIGFLAGPADVIAHCRNVLEWNVFTCNHVSQHALLAALEGPQDWVQDISPRYQIARELMLAELREAPGLALVTPGGGPFLFLHVRGLGIDAEAFRQVLLREYGVPTDPGRPFGSAAHVRLPFGGERDVVREAGRRIRAAALARQLT